MALDRRYRTGAGDAQYNGGGDIVSGMHYLRGFLPKISIIAAPIADVLRNKEFSSIEAHTRRVPLGPEVAAALGEIVERLTTYSSLVLPDWHKPFTLQTDASTLVAGSVLTQDVAHHRRQ